jgi:hypothetical protein
MWNFLDLKMGLKRKRERVVRLTRKERNKLKWARLSWNYLKTVVNLKTVLGP